MIEKFKEWVLFGLCYSEKTLEVYSIALKRFEDYLISLGKSLELPAQVKVRDIEEWSSYEISNGLSARSLNCYTAGIRKYFKYCKCIAELDGILDFQAIIFKKFSKKRIGCLNEYEVYKLKDTIAKENNEIIRVRNQIIINLLLHTGLRVSELINIKLEDLNNEELVVKGKGNKIRIVYLFESDRDLIKRFMELRELWCINNPYLVVGLATNNFGMRLSREGVRQMLNENGKKAGITQNVFPHLLRHTFATQILKRGGDIVYIQKLLGHSSINTTEQYLTINNPQLKEIQKLAVL